jgi:hypothetical protein
MIVMEAIDSSAKDATKSILLLILNSLSVTFAPVADGRGEDGASDGLSVEWSSRTLGIEIKTHVPS